MAEETFWQSLPELEILAQIAAYDDIEFRIRGSLAQRLLDHSNRSSSEPRNSLYNFVPPFSDIDILTEDRTVAARLHARIFEVLPGARFFHWEIQTQEDLARYKGLGSVILYNQPEILLRRRQKTTGDTRGATLILEFCRSSKELIATPQAASNVRLEFQDAWEADPKQILLDILYLARRFPDLLRSRAADLLNQIQKVSKRLPIQSYCKPRKILFPLLKFLFQNVERQRLSREWVDLHEILGEDLLQQLREWRKDALLDRLIGMCREMELRWTLIALVVPRRTPSRGWRRQIEDVFWAIPQHTSVQKADILLKKSRSGNHLGNFASPLVALSTEEPPSPGCCPFRDFARGIVEVGWIPVNMSHTNSLPLVAVITEGDEEPALVQTRLTVGVTSSFRLDYNLLCILNRSRRPLGLAVIGQED